MDASDMDVDEVLNEIEGMECPGCNTVIVSDSVLGRDIFEALVEWAGLI